ncbi:hypothetical protein Tco_0909492 [Tanacetum coccineum]|uniref:Uncharacterized protein n=1 Tax=Tanacetum coccineum TaxID=301880 RepID=A0ABQ5CRV6_9ASTR
MMLIVPEEGMDIEALQIKYPIIDWEVHSEDNMMEDLDKLWSLVKERFNSPRLIDDKEKELWLNLRGYLNQMTLILSGSCKDICTIL